MRFYRFETYPTDMNQTETSVVVWSKVREHCPCYVVLSLSISPRNICTTMQYICTATATEAKDLVSHLTR